MSEVGVDGGPTEFGRVVKRWRESRNLSQEALSLRANLSPAYVAGVETGHRGKRPSRDNVLALAQALNAPAAEFLRAAGRLEQGDPITPEKRPSFEDFVRSDPFLRKDQKDVLITTYRAFVGRTAGR